MCLRRGWTTGWTIKTEGVEIMRLNISDGSGTSAAPSRCLSVVDGPQWRERPAEVFAAAAFARRAGVAQHAQNSVLIPALGGRNG